MKVILSESQYNRLIEAEEKPKILSFPSLEFFDKDREVAWNIIQKILERGGNPPYSIVGALRLYGIPIESLGNLQSVGGYLDLYDTPIKSLGSLQSVGGYLDLQETPISKMYNEKQIRRMVNVEGDIYM
jgi:hypothetical protein